MFMEGRGTGSTFSFRYLFALTFILAVPAVALKPQQNQQQPMRAWMCHGKSQREMVDRLMQASIVKTAQVRDVMYAVDRGDYVPKNPYIDAPQGIGLGQTISAPHMHAHALEEIYPYLAKTQSDQPVKILDVGCGSGYLTAALGRWLKSGDVDSAEAIDDQPSILGRSGRVFGIDVKPNLIKLALENMGKNDGDLLETGTVKIQLADGWNGQPFDAPFDAIHVGAAASELPRKLAQQLKVGGVLIIPIGPEGEVQHLYRVERVHQSGPEYSEHDYEVTPLLGVRYVPLVHAAKRSE